MNRKDITMLAIACAKDKGLSPVQLQKTLFLLSKYNTKEISTDFYGFVPYNYGPFSIDVYSDADVLVQEGMAVKVPVPGQTWLKYMATPSGQVYSDTIKKQVTGQLTAYVETLVNWVSSLSFSELVRTIYAMYPEYRTNSVFQE